MRVTIHLFVAFQHSISITVFVVKLGVKSQAFNHFDISTQRELRKACTCRTIAVSGLLVAIAFFAGEEFEELFFAVEQRSNAFEAERLLIQPLEGCCGGITHIFCQMFSHSGLASGWSVFIQGFGNCLQIVHKDSL